MPKRVHKKRSTKRMGRRGGDVNETLSGVGNAISQGAQNVGSVVGSTVKGAYNETGALVGDAGQKTKGWFSSWFAPAPTPAVQPMAQPMATAPAPAVQPTAPMATAVAPAQYGGRGSRRRRHKKSKGMLSGLMHMMGIKTKKHRRHRGGIGGPPQGYNHIVGANFPSAAGPDGNNIYDLAKFDPSKPFTGGCASHKMGHLSPADFNASQNSYLLGGKTKRHRRRR